MRESLARSRSFEGDEAGFKIEDEGDDGNLRVEGLVPVLAFKEVGEEITDGVVGGGGAGRDATIFGTGLRFTLYALFVEVFIKMTESLAELIVRSDERGRGGRSLIVCGDGVEEVSDEESSSSS